MKTLKQYFEKAQEENFAVGQFNFSDFTQMKAIVEKCAELKSPIILGTSEGESNFFGFEEAVALRNVLRAKHNLPIFLNLDHGKTFDYVKKAIDAGYDMVHIDGSKLSLEENINLTKKVIAHARSGGIFNKKEVLVEGEVGKIGTESSKVYTEKLQAKEEDFTRPGEAKEFIKQTKVDLLAIGIGNFHGIQTSGQNPNLRIDILKKINEATGNINLVLHGGSGTPENDIREAIKNGVVKININTELRKAFAEGLKKSLNSGEIVPYKFLADAKTAVEEIVEEKIKLFDSINKI
jgi:fructose-bisphosphate aldolase class II